METEYLFAFKPLSRRKNNNMTKRLSISKFDKSLINDGVFSSNSKPDLNPDVRGKIVNSPVYEVYRNMAARSNDFMKEVNK